MRVKNCNLPPLQNPGDGRGEGNARRVSAGQLPEIQAGIAHNRVGELRIVASGVSRGNDHRAFAGGVNNIGIVFYCIGNAVNNRGERIV